MQRRPLSLSTWCLLASAVCLYAASFFLPAYREPQSGAAPGLRFIAPTPATPPSSRP